MLSASPSLARYLASGEEVNWPEVFFLSTAPRRDWQSISGKTSGCVQLKPAARVAVGA